MSKRVLFASLGLSLVLAGCGQNDKSNETPDSDYQRRLIERLIDFELREATVTSAGQLHTAAPYLRAESVL
jgi:major membrane immunogen (membrane-anchored lipoprotein)